MRATQLGEQGERVRHARLESARRVIEEASSGKVDFVLVTGDTFENNGVDRIKVREVAKILGAAGCPVYLIPGNHDPLTPGSVWETRHGASFPNLHVLKTPEPVDVAGAILYPCPVLASDSKEDPTAWIQADPGKIAIGIAHGSVENAGYEQVMPIARHAAGSTGWTIWRWATFIPRRFTRMMTVRSAWRTREHMRQRGSRNTPAATCWWSRFRTAAPRHKFRPCGRAAWSGCRIAARSSSLARWESWRRNWMRCRRRSARWWSAFWKERSWPRS